jgi:hypothetical protein
MQSVPETRQNSLVNEGEDEMDLLFPINEESDFEVVEDKLKKCSVFRKKLVGFNCKMHNLDGYKFFLFN